MTDGTSCICQYPGAWSIGLVPLHYGKIRDKACPVHGDKKLRRLCQEHFDEYVKGYGNDGEAVFDADNCQDCNPVASGAELTSDND